MADISTEVSTEVAGNTSTATLRKGTRARAWFLTIHEPTDEELDLLLSDDTEYLIYQAELCPTTGREHIHAVLYYAHPRVWPKRRYERAHIEKVGKLHKCIKYCSKEESRIAGPFEHGKRPEPGRRTDLEEMCYDVLEGKKRLEDIAEEDPMAVVRYSKGLQVLERMTYKHRTIKPTVLWLWGATGVGKTRSAFELPGTKYVKDGTQWWDGYRQEDVIIIDDFDGKWPLRDLLRLLDRYPYQGQVKGGYVAVNSATIVITCDRSPNGFWSLQERSQILRRIDAVRHLQEEIVGEIPEGVETGD